MQYLRACTQNVVCTYIYRYVSPVDWLYAKDVFVEGQARSCETLV